MLSNLRSMLKILPSHLSSGKAIILVIIAIAAVSFKANINTSPSHIVPINDIPAKVLFLPMTLKFDVIKNYYKKGNPSNDFGYFILQPIQEDATKWKDRYILIAYAYKANGTPMHDVSIPLKLEIAENVPTFRTYGRLNLGNLILSRKDLNELYKNQDTGDLLFDPRDSEKKDYVGYDVSISSVLLNKVVVKMDPCPPASCIFHK